jgi:hypothetical protein
MPSKLLSNVRCFFFGHKEMFLLSGMGKSLMTMHDNAGRELLAIAMCRFCHAMYWKRGMDVPSSLNSGPEIELFDAKNAVNRMVKAISNEAKDANNGEEAA